jgi:serine/threonine protein kinase
MYEQLDLTEDGYFPEKETRGLIQQAVKAVRRIHEFGAIHKNIKLESFSTSLNEGKGSKEEGRWKRVAREISC